MEQQKLKDDSWDDFSGVFIKASDVVFPFIVAVKSIDLYNDSKENKPKIDIVFEYQGKDRKIGLNKTNINFCKSNKLTPKLLIGKKITFEKVKNRNPKTEQYVDAFLINKIE